MSDFFDLQGKTALITGASSGLGEQFARCLHTAGARVILAARRIDALRVMGEELSNSYPLMMDVSDKLAVRASFQDLEKRGERIDICINNAGIAGMTPIFEDDAEERVESILQTNLMGLWYVTKAVANHMRDHKIPGSIINIASVNGQNKLRAGAAAYAASKAAVIQLTKALVGELSPHGIRINCLSPGLFHTPLTDYRLNTDELKKTMAATIPVGFVANPQDLDGALLLLASNKHAAYITGACLTVDGGISWGGSELAR